MTNENFISVRYVDVTIQQNYSPNPDKTIKTELKIPCFSIFQSLNILEFVFDVHPDNVLAIHVYRVNKIHGLTRYDYKLERNISQVEFKMMITNYKKFGRKIKVKL